MPFSAFARCGNGFRCSSRKPVGRAIYDSFRASHGNGEVFEEDGPIAARWFANAMAVGRSRQSLERARNQAEPMRCFDLLRAHERHYGIAVPSGATLHERRLALAAKHRLVLGPVRHNIEFQLEAALGSDFVAYVTTTADGSPRTHYPLMPWDLANSTSEPQGLFGIPPVWTRITLATLTGKGTLGNIVTLNTKITVAWQHIGGDEVSIAPGDRLVVDPYRRGRRELVRVSSVSTVGSQKTLSVIFTKTHPAHVEAIIWPFPYWMNRAKHSLVIVKNGRATDPEVRRRANDIMNALLGGTSTWDVVEESTTPGQCIGFVPGVGAPGITPIEALSF